MGPLVWFLSRESASTAGWWRLQSPVSSVASMLFGLIPALTTTTGLNDVLKESARGATAGRRWFRESMVALQVAASLVLLICAGLLIRSFLRVQQADLGFNARNVLTFELLLPAAQYGEPERRIAFYEAFRSRLQAIPGVVAVGAADRIPFGTSGWKGSFRGGSASRSRRAAAVGASRPNPAWPFPIARSAPASGAPFHRGRHRGHHTRCDHRRGHGAPFLSQRQDPIGRQITGIEPGLTATIVGVVGSVKRRDPSTAPEMSVYHAATQRAGPAMTFTVKTATDPLTMIPAIRTWIGRARSAPAA